MNLKSRVPKLEEELDDEKERSKTFKTKLDQKMKSIRMLNNGTQKLEHALSVGRTERGCRGLVYTSGDSGRKSIFISAMCENHVEPEEKTTTQLEPQAAEKHSGGIQKTRTTHVAPRSRMNKSYLRASGHQPHRCYSCGKLGHIRYQCYKKFDHVNQEGRTNSGLPMKTKRMWIKKSDLHGYSTKCSYIKVQRGAQSYKYTCYKCGRVINNDTWRSQDYDHWKNHWRRRC
ncbi:unnamed protein product [Cochlearia groenlandica]